MGRFLAMSFRMAKAMMATRRKKPIFINTIFTLGLKSRTYRVISFPRGRLAALRSPFGARSGERAGGSRGGGRGGG